MGAEQEPPNPAGRVSKRRVGRPRQRDVPLGIKGVEQAIAVIEKLAETSQPASLQDLSLALGMEPGKLHRYLVSLCAKRIAKQHDLTGLYELGPGALALGLAALTRLDEFELMREAANELSARFGQSTFVYVWAANGPVLVHNRMPPGALLHIRLGSIAPLVHSATGPVFVAYLPPGVTDPIIVRDALDRGLDPDQARRTAHGLLGPKIRADAVFWSKTSLLPNCAAVAAPVFNASGELLCVLGITSPLHGTRRGAQRAVTDALRDAAAALSSAAGFQRRG